MDRNPSKEIAPLGFQMTRSVLLGGAAALTWLFAVAAAHAVQANWPQTNHDGGRTGFNPKESTISASNVSGLQMVWGQGVAGDVTSFALNKGTLYFQGGSPSVLTAVNANTGAVNWTVSTGNDGGGNANIAVDKSGVYGGCSQTDTSSGTPDGAVCAYNPSTGALRWVYCACASGGDAAVVQALTYDNGVLYFGYAHHVDGVLGLEEYVVAVDAASGTQLWATDFGSTNAAGSLGNSPVTVGAGNVYVSCAVSGSTAALCALAQANGSLTWHYDLNPIANGLDDIGLAERNNSVYANINGAAAQIAALDATTGAVKWSIAEQGVCCGAPPPAVDGPALFVPFRDPQNNLASTIVALKTRTGKQLWKADANGACASPSVANGVVYEKNCGGDNTVTVSAFNAKTGAFLWSNPDAAGGHYPPPIIANGTVYIANISHQNYNIAAFQLPGAKEHR
jgi:outer membrane protein assembly factor BamB